jgi:riboflavin biosynthesis pyrimidine reductase
LGRRAPRRAVRLRDRRSRGRYRVAQEIAGDRVVSVSGGTIATQCLDLGLLDEVAVDLVPVIMGAGNRSFFGQLSTNVLLDNPTVCIQGDRVTHLVYPVLRDSTQ